MSTALCIGGGSRVQQYRKIVYCPVCHYPLFPRIPGIIPPHCTAIKLVDRFTEADSKSVEQFALL